MGIQKQIYLILRFWILVKCCVLLGKNSSKTLLSLLEKNIFHKYGLFCYRFNAFTFDFCSLLPISAYDRIPDNFTSPVWNFCQRVAHVPPREKSLAAKSEEERLFSKAKPIYTINIGSKAFYPLHSKAFCPTPSSKRRPTFLTTSGANLENS